MFFFFFMAPSKCLVQLTTRSTVKHKRPFYCPQVSIPFFRAESYWHLLVCFLQTSWAWTSRHVYNLDYLSPFPSLETAQPTRLPTTAGCVMTSRWRTVSPPRDLSLLRVTKGLSSAFAGNQTEHFWWKEEKPRYLVTRENSDSWRARPSLLEGQRAAQRRDQPRSQCTWNAICKTLKEFGSAGAPVHEALCRIPRHLHQNKYRWPELSYFSEKVKCHAKGVRPTVRGMEAWRKDWEALQFCVWETARVGVLQTPRFWDYLLFLRAKKTSWPFQASAVLRPLKAWVHSLLWSLSTHPFKHTKMYWMYRRSPLPKYRFFPL